MQMGSRSGLITPTKVLQMNMRLEVDAREVDSFDSLLRCLSVSAGTSLQSGSSFGWDLHSLQDCLHGTSMHSPPYEIVITHAELVISRLGHGAAARYWERMISVVDGGGRGLAHPGDRGEFIRLREAAIRGCGPTMLEMVIEVTMNSPATLTLIPGRRTGGSLI